MGQEISDFRPDTIAAVSTPAGSGGIAVIRMSGPDAIQVLKKIWKGKDPESFESHSSHLGWITDEEGKEIDQTVATLFRAPNSFTGEDLVEISCHGSRWIQQAIVNRLVECGAKGAAPGEFTRRAFMNGRLDLAQAEGVADLIAASSKAGARLAVTQLRGDFSDKLKELRSKLIDLGSLLELELDFSEEDVEFADRKQLIDLAQEINQTVSRLARSYKSGSVFKSGIPVVIAGVPNAGKSTLLNTLIGEEKAIVSEIAGTTRDVIEDTLEISGILFRFFDTAGIRESDDKIESIGVKRAMKKLTQASIILCLIDPTETLEKQRMLLQAVEKEAGTADIFYVITKSDLVSESQINEPLHLLSDDKESDNITSERFTAKRICRLSAATGDGIEGLKNMMVDIATLEFNPEQELIVTNSRHYEALRNAEQPLQRLIDGLRDGVSGDFLAQDLREAEYYLGTVTGEINSTEILHTIFSRFCIGK